jgi:hypothetical protein
MIKRILMKPVTGILCAFLAFPALSTAQSFDTGDNVLGLTFGIGGHYTASGSGYSSQSPAIGLFYEHGMPWEAGPGTIGLGGYVGYKTLRYKSVVFPFTYDWRWNYTILGVRGAYHYEFLENLDTYGGLMLSYHIVSFSDKSFSESGYYYVYTGGSASGVDLSLFLGGRYYFSEKFGALLELGYGIAYLNLGLAYKW